MNRLFKLGILVVAAAAIGAPVGAQQRKPPTSPVTGNAVAGKKLYYNYSCFSCHGYNGETGARAFVGNWDLNLSTEENFIKFLRARANVAPLTPSTEMPNFSEKTMSDKQAKDIYAYIRTFKPAQPDPKNIAVLQQIMADASKPAKN